MAQMVELLLCKGKALISNPSPTKKKKKKRKTLSKAKAKQLGYGPSTRALA
jgi:hypothetical protein